MGHDPHPIRCAGKKTVLDMDCAVPRLMAAEGLGFLIPMDWFYHMEMIDGLLYGKDLIK